MKHIYLFLFVCLLSGCWLQSDEPLITASNAVQPLPDRFALLGSSLDGVYYRDGWTYRMKNASEIFALARLSGSETDFALEVSKKARASDERLQHRQYFVRIEGHTLNVLWFPDNDDLKRWANSNGLSDWYAARYFKTSSSDGFRAQGFEDLRTIYRAMREVGYKEAFMQEPMQMLIVAEGDQLSSTQMEQIYREAMNEGVLSKRAERLAFLGDHGYAKAQTALGRLLLDGGQSVKPDYERARLLFAQAADQGDPAAYTGLGDIYRRGLGVTADPQQALDWYRRASEAGDQEAPLRAAEMYAEGAEVAQSDTKAVEWLRVGVANGSAEAQARLGRRYLEGSGVERNPQEALRLLTAGADAGNAEAQYQMGLVYKLGEHVEADAGRAAKLFAASAEQDHYGAKFELGQAYQFGAGVEKDFLKAQSLYLSARYDGEIEMALLRYGQLHEKGGYGIDRDCSHAIDVFLELAKKGMAAAQYQLGEIYYDGECVEADYDEAERWLKLAEKNGDRLAGTMLLLVQNKRDTEELKQQLETLDQPRDCEIFSQTLAESPHYMLQEGLYRARPESIADWIEGCAETGQPESLFLLAGHYQFGAHREQDYARSIALVRQAAELGLSQAQFYLGYLYSAAEAGLPEDLEKSLFWFRKAAAQGHPEAPGFVRMLEKEIRDTDRLETTRTKMEELERQQAEICRKILGVRSRNPTAFDRQADAKTRQAVRECLQGQ